MTRKFQVVMLLGGVFGLGLYVYAEVAGLHGGWKALAVVLGASGLDIFWDIAITWMEKREGEID